MAKGPKKRGRPGRFTDQQMIEAVASEGSLRGAAIALGVQPNALHHRLRTRPPTFRAEVDEARADALTLHAARRVGLPSDEVLVELGRGGGMDALAERVGVTRLTLWRNMSAAARADVAKPRASATGRRFVNRAAPDEATATAAAFVRRDPCAYCGGSADAVDHITALAAGGALTWDNLTAACRACNSRKRATPMLMFLLKRRAGVRRIEALYA